MKEKTRIKVKGKRLTKTTDRTTISVSVGLRDEIKKMSQQKKQTPEECIKELIAWRIK